MRYMKKKKPIKTDTEIIRELIKEIKQHVKGLSSEEKLKFKWRLSKFIDKLKIESEKI
jgi:hypothetical protein